MMRLGQAARDLIEHLGERADINRGSGKPIGERATAGMVEHDPRRACHEFVEADSSQTGMLNQGNQSQPPLEIAANRPVGGGVKHLSYFYGSASGDFHSQKGSSVAPCPETLEQAILLLLTRQRE
jgi:hypothetical protein